MYIWLLDMGKYGEGIIGMFWEEQESIISEIVEVDQKFLGRIPTGRKVKKKVERLVPGYVGNKIYNIRPFDFHPDPRVPLARFQEGEF